MNTTLIIIILLILIIIAEFLALYYIKLFSLYDDHIRYILCAMIYYIIVVIIFYRILKNGQGIAMTNMIWNIASTIYGLLIGVIIFNEKLTNLQKIGATFGTLSVIMMLWHER